MFSYLIKVLRILTIIKMTAFCTEILRKYGKTVEPLEEIAEYRNQVKLCDD
jgi:hypothetical protein